MRDGKRLTGIVLLVGLAFGAGWMLPAKSGALDTGQGEEWVITAAAAARSAVNGCPGHLTPVCRELCVNNVPTGDFMCFVD